MIYKKAENKINYCVSYNGINFFFYLEIKKLLNVGDLIKICGGITDASFIGQITKIHLLKNSYKKKDLILQGEGLIISSISLRKKRDKNTIKGSIHDLSRDEIQNYLESKLKGIRLQIGVSNYRDKINEFFIDTECLNRHTLLCGQSGSGKSFALAIIIEQLLLRTKTKIIVFDPNSDFVKIRDIKPIKEINKKNRYINISEEKYEEIVNEFNEVSNKTTIFQNYGSVDSKNKPIRIKFNDFSIRDQGRILGLDPIRDSEPYNQYLKYIDENKQFLLRDILSGIREDLKRRFENHNFDKNEIFIDNEEETSCLDQIIKDWRAIIFDLGSVPLQISKTLISLAVLNQIWNNREKFKKDPIVFIIDEAHYLCSPNPINPIQESLLEKIRNIATEGRKYGIFLLLVTQSPSQIDSLILSQINNSIIMKMVSNNEIEKIEKQISNLPNFIIKRIPMLNKGEAILSGKISSYPSIVKFESRLTEEGGDDIIIQ